MNTPARQSKALSVWLLIASAIGLFAAAMLVLEKISFWQQKAEGTAPKLGCDINPIVGCGPIINTDQASIFWDIPNPLIGVIAFSALGAIAVMLFSGMRLPEWMWAGLQLGVVFGLAIITFLQYSSIWVLYGLCPYCMVVWAIMIPTFWVVTSCNLRVWRPDKKLAEFVYNWTTLLITLHFMVIASLIWFQFGSSLWA